MDITEAVNIKKRWQKYTEELYQKSLCITKETINKVKRQPSEWEKIIANETTDKQLISKIYKQLMQLNTRKINDLIKTMDQRTKQTFLQRRHADG